jgi:hypothetical protein
MRSKTPALATLAAVLAMNAGYTGFSGLMDEPYPYKSDWGHDPDRLAKAEAKRARKQAKAKEQHILADFNNNCVSAEDMGR